MDSGSADVLSGRHFVRTALEILSGRPDKTFADLFPIPWHEGRKRHPCEGQKTAAQADPPGNINGSEWFKGNKNKKYNKTNRQQHPPTEEKYRNK